MKKLIEGMAASYAGNGGHILNDEQKELTKAYGVSWIAEKIRDKIDLDGERWFTASSIRSRDDKLYPLAKLGVIKKVNSSTGGIYYKHTQLTIPFCNTAKEWAKESKKDE